MTNLIHKFTRIFEWLFPMRSAMRQEIDWLASRLDKTETRFDEMELRYTKKFDEMEKRYSEDCCFRKDCPERINRFSLHKKTNNDKKRNRTN